jgi:HK97 gp10 family phage protein
MATIKEGKNNRKVFAHIEFSAPRARIGMRVGLFQVGKFVVKVARDGIKTGPKTGRVYKFKSRNKRASSPGEYPANRTGKLRRSVDFTVEGFKKMRFGAGKEYGKFLETGTRNMEPRPTLKKTVDKTASATKNILQKSLNEEIKRG